MKTTGQSGSFPVVLLLLMVGILFAPLSQAEIDVLDSVDVAHAEGYSTLRVHLNIPVQVKRFAPERAGEFIRIFVEPVATLGAEGDSVECR